MSFDYSIAAASQTPLTPPARAVYCKSFKIDLSVTNATTAVAYPLGKLPKASQIVFSNIGFPTAVSGASVSAATLAVAAGASNVLGGINVFATGTSNSVSSTLFSGTYGVAQTTDVTLTYTLTLTGGATATAGVIWVNIYYVA